MLFEQKKYRKNGKGKKERKKESIITRQPLKRSEWGVGNAKRDIGELEVLAVRWRWRKSLVVVLLLLLLLMRLAFDIVGY